MSAQAPPVAWPMEASQQEDVSATSSAHSQCNRGLGGNSEEEEHLHLAGQSVEACGVHQVIAKAYDNPIPGYKTSTVGNLRLWEALPLCEFDLDAFNEGKYDKVRAIPAHSFHSRPTPREGPGNTQSHARLPPDLQRMGRSREGEMGDKSMILIGSVVDVGLKIGRTHYLKDHLPRVHAQLQIWQAW